MNKKLMILGGSRYIRPLIKKAHELGIYVITCDYLPDNYAHKFSDEYINVSIVDKEAVLKKAIELNIDGITSFACDPGVITAAYVAEKMGLPNVGPYESVCILQNKAKFRAFLKEHNFNVPTSKGYSSIKLALQEANLFHWPVIVKPTDSAGSKGVKRVEKKSELIDAINYALNYSRNGEFIIEDFLDKVGCSSDSDCFSIDGKMVFYSFSSQMFDEKCENPYVPSAYYWPSTISNNHINELKSEIQRLITLLDMKTSVYNIETRECSNGKVYIMELTPRGGGNRLSEMADLAIGSNIIENHVRYCVGLPLLKTTTKNFSLLEIILHSKIPGAYDHLWIEESIKQYVLEEDIWIDKNDSVGGFKGANEAIGTLVLKFNKFFKMIEVANSIDEYIKVVIK